MLNLEGGDISTEMGSDIRQVMICFLAKCVWRVRGCTLGKKRIYVVRDPHSWLSGLMSTAPADYSSAYRVALAHIFVWIDRKLHYVEPTQAEYQVLLTAAFHRVLLISVASLYLDEKQPGTPRRDIDPFRWRTMGPFYDWSIISPMFTRHSTFRANERYSWVLTTPKKR